MAKYTETLQEYLQDNELPEEFEEIEGFENVFKAHFIDKEIGFETEELFKVKLSGRASLVIPMYKERIASINSYLTKIANPTKEITFEMGAQKSKTTELPINALTAEPSLVNDNDEYENTQTEKDYSITNIISMIKFLKGEDANIITKLLGEFDSLFMQVY